MLRKRSWRGIAHVNSVKGNADYTITEPVHYPFAFSESAPLRWASCLAVATMVRST